MATIKTTGTGTGLRILTKTASEIQRVSCTCCEVCCPYPADQLGVGYFASDLPETLIIREGDLVPRYVSRTGNLTGTIYGPVVFEKTVIRGDETFIVEYSLSIEIAESPSGLQWHILTLQDGFEITLEAFDICLYREDDPANSSFSAITDTFADAYEVSGPVSGIVTRESLCVWSGEGLTLSNFGYQWRVNGRNKSGNQNTPVGSYADGYIVSL